MDLHLGVAFWGFQFESESGLYLPNNPTCERPVIL